MKWHIVADSSIDLFALEKQYDSISFSTVPFAIGVGEKEYLDDEHLNLPEMMAHMHDCKEASRTACPSTGAWYEQFTQPGPVIAVTITSGLSGSYNSACAARDMVLEDEPNKQLAVIDSLSTGPEMILIVRKLCELISEGKDFDAVLHGVHAYMNHTHVTFALCSFDNLVKNGRMNRITGFIAHKLGLLGVGIASEKGTIEMKGVSRGRRRAIEAIVNDMRMRGTFIKDVVISYCMDLDFAEQVKAAVQSVWQEANVTLLPTRGLCSYYAERGGLIIGF